MARSSLKIVSIADATLASPQRNCAPGKSQAVNRFQSQTRRLLPRNLPCICTRLLPMVLFQSQTRRLLPRNGYDLASLGTDDEFQSQTRRLLPRNVSDFWTWEKRGECFNRRRDACFPATHRVGDSRAAS